MNEMLAVFLGVIADAWPVLVGVIGGVIGIVLLIALGRYIVSRVRYSMEYNRTAMFDERDLL